MPSPRAAPRPPAPKHRPSSPNPVPQPFKRVLLKLSGEAFCAPGGFGVDAHELEVIASEVKSAKAAGSQLAVAAGAGNLIRGAQIAEAGHIHRATADYMGMLGSVINALALREKLGT